MDAKGQPGARADTGAVYRQRRVPRAEPVKSNRQQAVERVVQAETLDVALKPAMAGIEEARFARGVRFVEGGPNITMPAGDPCASAPSAKFRMCASAMRYDLEKGLVELTGSEPGSLRPRVVNDRMAIDATRIDVALAGPDVKAAGAVKSVMQAAREQERRDAGAKTATPRAVDVQAGQAGERHRRRPRLQAERRTGPPTPETRSSGRKRRRSRRRRSFSTTRPAI